MDNKKPEICVLMTSAIAIVNVVGDIVATMMRQPVPTKHGGNQPCIGTACGHYCVCHGIAAPPTQTATQMPRTAAQRLGEEVA